MPCLHEFECLSFDDVSLLDGMGKMSSRDNVDLSICVDKGDKELSFIPIFSASMSDITSPELDKDMSSVGAFCIHHRYQDLQTRVNNCSGKNSGVAIGLGDDIKEIEEHCIENDVVKAISLDVASCWHKDVLDKMKEIVSLDLSSTMLIAGNFSNCNFIYDLSKRGLLTEIDFLKVSQGGGSVCSTRREAGFGMPTWQAVKDLYEALQKLDTPSEKLPRIIADGGIKSSGDIVKSIGAGASGVMLGSMLSGHYQCNGKVIDMGDGEKYMRYAGMASDEVKESNFDDVNHVEGEVSYTPYKGDVLETLSDIYDGIRSGIATCGFTSLQNFIGMGNFIRVSRASQIEARPHKKIEHG